MRDRNQRERERESVRERERERERERNIDRQTDRQTDRQRRRMKELLVLSQGRGLALSPGTGPHRPIRRRGAPCGPG